MAHVILGSMRKLLEIVGALSILGLLFAQLMGPEKHNMRSSPANDVQTQTGMPDNVAAILHRACYDCHSQKTQWRWYAAVAPFSWLQIADVDAGRAHLDFSNWTNFTAAQKEDRLRGMCKLTRGGGMPLWYYKPLHPAAWLSDNDRRTICSWTDAMLAKLAADPNAAGQNAPALPASQVQQEKKSGQP